MRLTPAFALALSAVAGAAAQPHSHDPHLGHPHDHDLCGIEACGKAALLRQMFERGLTPEGDRPGGFTPREGFLDTDVLNNNLDIEVIPATETIVGSNTMTIRSMVNNLTEFTFCLRNNFNISEVRFNDSQNLAAPVFVGSYARRVTLPRPIAAGETFTLRIAYSGVAVSRGFGSIEFRTIGGQPAVFTLSEPYYAATWWPAKDADFATAGDNADKATFDIAITAPTALTVASNGLLQGIDVLSGNRRKHRWRTDYPMASYLACFGAAVYNTWSTTYTYPGPGGPATMPLQFFITPGNNEPALRQTWERSTDMMAAFRPVYGEYPFINEKYGIYEFVFGGGMEHQTMTGQSPSTSLSLTAHELAHQWWGDNVTCRTWSDIWLNEGFATYSECIWAERASGTPDRAALLTAINARRPGNLATGSVYRYDVSSADTIFSGTFAYNKGAWVLHTLRKTLGDAKFFELLQYYRSIFQGSAATTDDFAAAATLIAGWNMAPYFDAWVYGQGTPSFATGFQRTVINGQPYLRLRIRQTQSDPAPAYFPCGLDIRIATASGTQDAFVIPGGGTSWHLIPLTVSGAVTSVTLDREDWVLNQGKITEAYLAGPPRIIATSPAPAEYLTTRPDAITIGFSDTVVAASQAFTVFHGATVVPTTYSYNASTSTVTLTPTQPLAAGEYSVVVSEIVTANGGQRLDGEILPRGLPSGNGVAGGSASFAFTVAPCAADFNHDGFLDFFDYDEFVTCFETTNCGSETADFNQDGFVDFFDYDDFVAAFEQGC